MRSTLESHATGHQGIARPQQRLRDALEGGDLATALSWREDDALLRALTTGISSYYSAQFERSAAVFDSAAMLADDRITASVSRNALALVTNDMARPYQPRRLERLLIPYYGMMSYVQLADWDGAAVEARRLESLLAQYALQRDDAERATHALLHHLAGVVLEQAGQAMDAEVSYRSAHALDRSYAERVLTGTRAGSESNRAGEGEILLVLESGFVAHRSSESIDLVLGEENDSSRVAMAMAVAVLRRSARVWGAEARLSLDGDDATMRDRRMIGGALLDDAAGADERRERFAVLARATGRAVAKRAVTRAVKDRRGKVAGAVAGVGAALLERADIRSWHLLPQELVVFRFAARAGYHQVAVEFGEGAERRSVAVGPVLVRAGRVNMAALRLWQPRAGAAGSPRRLAESAVARPR